MKRNASGIVLILAVCAAFAATWPFRGDWADRAANFKMQRPLAGVTSWRFLSGPLQGDDRAGDASPMIVVAAPAPTSPPVLTANAVADIKYTRNGHRRIVLAELSVAAISDQAPAWHRTWRSDPPAWLAERICASPETHRVRYWLPGWRNLIYRARSSTLSRIQDAGFDGVYLKDVDAFAADISGRPSARREMTDLVMDLASTARARQPGFLVVAESGEDLLADTDYRRAIDAVATRDLLAHYNGLSLHSALQRTSLPAPVLRRLRLEGKPVFTLEDRRIERPLERAAIELRRRGIVIGFKPHAASGRQPESTTTGASPADCAGSLSW